MNRRLTCLFFAWLLREAPAVSSQALQPAARPGWRAMTDTVRAVKPGWLLVRGDVQALKSTHDNYFLGGSITAVHPFARTVELGLGAEVSHAQYHPDNGWQLYHLYFIPLFVATRFKLFQRGRTTVYLQTDQGVSLGHYQKQEGVISPTRYGVTEYGYYGYAGGGLRWGHQARFNPGRNGDEVISFVNESISGKSAWPDPASGCGCALTPRQSATQREWNIRFCQLR